MQLTEKDVIDALTRGALGVTKVQTIGANAAKKPVQALTDELNRVLRDKTKEGK